MTVCIAAHCYRDKSVICASDMLVTTGEMSADMSARKIRAVGDHWFCMFAGNDISPVNPILRSIKRTLIATGKESYEDIAAAFISAYKEQLKLKAENEVLASLGYSLEDFKKDGLAQLGAEAFSRLLYEIQQQTLDLTFLIAGFDKDHDEPFIFTVTPPGKVDDYSEVGFWAIGSGQTNAIGSLFNATQRVRFMSRANAIYRVCEAKFNAETAVGVGPTTSVLILKNNGDRCQLSTGQVDELKPVWEKTRTVKVPDEGETIIGKILTEADKKWVRLAQNETKSVE